MGMFDYIQLAKTRKHACCKRRVKMLQTKDALRLMRVYIEGQCNVIEPVYKAATDRDRANYAKRNKTKVSDWIPFMIKDGKKTRATLNPTNVPVTGYDWCKHCESMSYLDGVFDATGKLFINTKATKEIVK